MLSCIEDVLKALFADKRDNCWDRGTELGTTAFNKGEYVRRGGRCSVIIKPIMIEGRFDLAIAHNTW
jgi:hypothetical protein